MEKNDRLRRSRQAAGYPTAAAAARALGVKEPTYAGHENGSRSFDEEAARLYARKFKVSPSWLMWGTDQPALTDDQQEMERSVDKGLAYSPLSLSDATLPVLGVVAAGMWLEVDPLADRDNPHFSIPVPPDPRLPRKAMFGLTVSGSSINKIASEGDVLVCTSIAETGIQIVHGDLVIVERRRGQEGLHEVTAKRVYQTPGRIELRPESTDPKWQEPIVIREDEDDGHTEIRIIARVEWVFRNVRGSSR